MNTQNVGEQIEVLVLLDRSLVSGSGVIAQFGGLKSLLPQMLKPPLLREHRTQKTKRPMFRLCLTFLESHPFRIVSWVVDTSSKPKLTTVHLLVESRDRFIYRLVRYAKRSSEGTRHLILYSGPYGTPTSIKEYGTVLLIATEFGIAAILPHLKELLDGYRRCEVVTWRVYIE